MISKALKEMLPEYIKAGILNDYDLTPWEREEHDLKAEFNANGERIKATIQDRREFWKKILSNYIISKEKKLKENEKVNNPWAI